MMLQATDSIVEWASAPQPGLSVVRPNSILQISVPAISRPESYLVSSSWIEEPLKDVRNKRSLATTSIPQSDMAPTSLVRLLSIDVSKENVKVQALQRWTGRVERILKDRFVAIISDITTPGNPAEEVELDIQEVPPADRSLVAEGAIFYWAIVYRDSKGGQRERISSIRFARQPKLSEEDVQDILAEADEMAAFLESA